MSTNAADRLTSACIIQPIDQAFQAGTAYYKALIKQRNLSVSRQAL